MKSTRMYMEENGSNDGTIHDTYSAQQTRFLIEKNAS